MATRHARWIAGQIPGQDHFSRARGRPRGGRAQRITIVYSRTMAARRSSPRKKTKQTSRPAPLKTPGDTKTVLYLYGVTRADSASRSVSAPEAGGAKIVAVRCGELLCWASTVSRAEFVDRLESNMQDLEWLANASVRHQAVLNELGKRGTVLPARFGLVFSNEEALKRHAASRRRELV